MFHSGTTIYLTTIEGSSCSIRLYHLLFWSLQAKCARHEAR